MPFTPFHMGPGILVKAILQSSFSLMVFGWAQIVMDLQPLVVLLTGKGHLHGFSHTYIGATLIALFSGVTGKYLSEIGLSILRIPKFKAIRIPWPVVFLSSFIGSFSHVLLDSVMHSDLEPFYPFTNQNAFLGLISIQNLHKLCLYMGLLGGAVYFLVQWRSEKT